jgi:uncharacterized protein YjbJ (UPF0337 family)
MTDKKNTGPQEGVKGVVEDVKGKAKEAVGTVTGRDDLVREGKAQQDKADAQQDVAKKEALRSARRPSSGRNSFEREGPAGNRLGLYLVSSATGALPVYVGMFCVPTLFDAAYPHVLDQQPPRAHDEPGAGQGRQGQPDVVVAGGKRREARHEKHQRDADHNEPRHYFVVLHRLAGVRPRCPRVVDRILRALHRYSSLGIPTPAKHGLISTVELPDTVVGETVTEM